MVDIVIERQDVFIFFVVVDCCQTHVLLVEDGIFIALPFFDLKHAVAFGVGWEISHFLRLWD